MANLPPIAGWPTELPDKDPSRCLYLFYEDLMELKTDHHLAGSQGWLSKFAKNALNLEMELDHFKSSRDFALDLLKIHNWLKNAKEKGISLSEALFIAKKNNFKELHSLKEFVHEFVDKDKHAFDHLTLECASYLKKKKYLR